jgi:UDP-N-acetylmuramate dehydrogenase
VAAPVKLSALKDVSAVPAPRNPSGLTNVRSVPAPVELSALTTLGLGGPAPELIVGDTAATICDAIAGIDRRGGQVLLIAGGSNLVIADAGVDYPVLHIANTGVEAVHDGDDLLVTVAAGENWDSVVEMFTAEGWSGIEMLSGVPGSAGATPIQNVGAYGAEISDVLEDVTVYDRRARASRTIRAADLGLGYRSSILRGCTDAVLLSLRLRLGHRRRPIRYGELAATLGVAPGHGVPAADVRAAVLVLRRRKGMVLDPADPDTRSVGSFFTNPLLSSAEAADVDAAITAKLGPEVKYPRYPAGQATKLSAAWLIEKAGFGKGFALPQGGAAISSKHTLALTSRGGSTEDLVSLARHVRGGVDDAFGVELHVEPILVGVAL